MQIVSNARTICGFDVAANHALDVGEIAMIDTHRPSPVFQAFIGRIVLEMERATMATVFVRDDRPRMEMRIVGAGAEADLRGFNAELTILNESGPIRVPTRETADPRRDALRKLPRCYGKEGRFRTTDGRRFDFVFTELLRHPDMSEFLFPTRGELEGACNVMFVSGNYEDAESRTVFRMQTNPRPSVAERALPREHPQASPQSFL